MLYNITIVLCLKISAPASCTEDQYNCLFMKFKYGINEAKIEVLKAAVLRFLNKNFKNSCNSLAHSFPSPFAKNSEL